MSGGPPSHLVGEALTVGYPAAPRPILERQSLHLPPGRITALIGPNGSGKTTLLKALGRQLPLAGGRVLLDGRSVARLAPRSLARQLGILFQEKVSVPGLTVGQLATHGRHPHRGLLEGLSSEDLEAVERALTLTGMAALRHRPLGQLSGGQRQLAWLALALAQQPRVLLLDEPTTFLDLRHQIEVMEIIVKLRDQAGITVAMVVHDVNQAARYADHLFALKDGRLIAEGAPRQLLTAALLGEVFDIDAEVITGSDGVPTCIPRGLPGARPTQASANP